MDHRPEHPRHGRPHPLTRPDLVATLRAYYFNDMNRTAAAAALHIHRRTLDYRLQRVRTATGVDPVSTVGVRLLSAAVGRIVAADRHGD